MQLRKLGAMVGAEIGGIDLAAPLDQGQVAEIREALAENGVVFFRDQHLTPEQHIAFAERFAAININRFFRPVEGYPQIAEVRKEPGQTKNIGGGWHTDHSYDQVPALGSILLARELPEMGGDTLFASMVAAWEALSPGMRQTLSGMRAVHSSRHAFGNRQREEHKDGRYQNADQAVQDAIHPVGLKVPGTGRTALYVNPSFTLRFEGWTDEESKPLLDFLYRHAQRPEFQMRFQWREGSIAFWDNRLTWHYALNDYQGERRLMHRVTLEGVPLQ
ncbi:TauD/TfdA dioxygenase family protein [Siccirubricoccus phaeus]|uniref:TauD/TfdA dioxygenase family protein n=1 Tax=Siccirubricoccus phaeus TaxID=2595053 RepID=UPI0011F16485|nr:TauD/TfdA family dioxygenase [Siccirubricoccus phaeus]